MTCLRKRISGNVKFIESKSTKIKGNIFFIFFSFSYEQTAVSAQERKGIGLIKLIKYIILCRVSVKRFEITLKQNKKKKLSIFVFWFLKPMTTLRVLECLILALRTVFPPVVIMFFFCGHR